MSNERGFLTKTDREFLSGEKEYTGKNAKQQRYERREAIATRARQAFHDFAFLHATLDEHERNRIFDPPADETPDLMRAMIDTIAFFYHALEGDSGSNAVVWERTFRYPFRQVLEAGVKHGELSRQQANGEHHFTGNPEVTFDVEVTRSQPADWSRVVEALAQNGGRGLTDQELRAVIVHAADDTANGADAPTLDGEPLEEALDEYHGSDLRALAKSVEEKARELEDTDE